MAEQKRPRRPNDIVFRLESSKRPLAVRIAHAISRDIRSGRLRPGERLPGSRSLAEHLNVHRNTVLAAYRELQSEGWIDSRAGHSTYVCEQLPSSVYPRRSRTPRSGFDDRVGYPVPPRPRTRTQTTFHLQGLINPNLINPSLINLSDATPDVRLLPTAALGRAYRRAMRSRGSALLGYGDPQGHPKLRQELARFLSSTRGLVVSPANVLVTRGSQMALSLVAKLLLGQHDVVAVEAFGYPPAWDSLSGQGATLVPVSIDQDGLNVEQLEQMAASQSLRAVYLTPHHQYPTMATLGAARRLRLLDLARRKKIIVIEDDYDHEFHYDGRPVWPLASTDEHGVVLYVGTLSKVLAPGIRVGYLVAPRSIIERATELRLSIDRQGDLATEYAVAELLEDGEVQRHIHRMRRIYRARRDALLEALACHLSDAITAPCPPGGMALWARTHSDVDVNAWAARAAQQDIIVHVAQQFSFSKRRAPYLRLGFASRTETELNDAIARLASVF